MSIDEAAGHLQVTAHVIRRRLERARAVILTIMGATGCVVGEKPAAAKILP